MKECIRELEEAVNDLQNKWVETPVGTPGDCDCGRDKREHIMDSLNAAEALLVLLRDSNGRRWIDGMVKEGPNFYLMAVAFVSNHKEVNDSIDRQIEIINRGLNGSRWN